MGCGARETLLSDRGRGWPKAEGEVLARLSQGHVRVAQKGQAALAHRVAQRGREGACPRIPAREVLTCRSFGGSTREFGLSSQLGPWKLTSCRNWARHLPANQERSRPNLRSRMAL